MKRPYDRLKSREKSHFRGTGRNLAKAGVFRWVTNNHEHKDITIPLIIHYYLLKSEHYTNLSTLIITSSFFRVSTGALA